MGALAVASTVAQAQAVDAGAATAAALPAAPAAEQPVSRSLVIVPTLSISETLTDNSRLTSTDRRGDLITEVSPGIRVASNGGRVKGFFDYSLRGLLYARNTSSTEVQNALNARANVEAIDNWAFVDASASISQQSISAFGTQSADARLANSNQTEVRTYNLSPYVRGQLASAVDYEARLTRESTRSSSDDNANSDTTRVQGKLGGKTRFTAFSWDADATHEIIDFSTGRRTTDDRLRGLLHYAVTPELRLTGIMGRERNDYVSAEKESRNTPGWGVDWNPTERTRLSAQREQRFFGSSHAYTFQHRMPRSVWSYSDTRDIRTGFNQPTLGSLGSAFNLIFTGLTSAFPDPVQRADETNRYLQSRGISPNQQIFVATLSNAVMLERRQELSLALLGLRDTVTIVASRTQSSQLDSVLSLPSEFANNNVRQSGLSVTLAHRLTPTAALNLVAAQDSSSGDQAGQSTRLRTVTLAWTDQIGPNTRAGLAARHTNFDSPSSPYTESAVIASLSLQF